MFEVKQRKNGGYSWAPQVQPAVLQVRPAALQAQPVVASPNIFQVQPQVATTPFVVAQPQQQRIRNVIATRWNRSGFGQPIYGASPVYSAGPAYGIPNIAATDPTFYGRWLNLRKGQAVWTAVITIIILLLLAGLVLGLLFGLGIISAADDNSATLTTSLSLEIPPDGTPPMLDSICTAMTTVVEDLNPDVYSSPPEYQPLVVLDCQVTEEMARKKRQAGPSDLPTRREYLIHLVLYANQGEKEAWVVLAISAINEAVGSGDAESLGPGTLFWPNIVVKLEFPGYSELAKDFDITSVETTVSMDLVLPYGAIRQRNDNLPTDEQEQRWCEALTEALEDTITIESCEVKDYNVQPMMSHVVFGITGTATYDPTVDISDVITSAIQSDGEGDLYEFDLTGVYIDDIDLNIENRPATPTSESPQTTSAQIPTESETTSQGGTTSIGSTEASTEAPSTTESYTDISTGTSPTTTEPSTEPTLTTPTTTTDYFSASTFETTTDVTPSTTESTPTTTETSTEATSSTDASTTDEIESTTETTPTTTEPSTEATSSTDAATTDEISSTTESTPSSTESTPSTSMTSTEATTAVSP